MAPGRQHLPAWLACLVGVGCALLGTALVTVLSVASTRGFGIEVGLQVALAAVGMMTVAGLYGRDVRT